MLPPRRAACCLFSYLSENLRKYVLALTLLGFLAGALGGCAFSRQRTNSGPTRTADGKILLNFWNGFTGPDGRAMEKMVAQFQAQNPNIAVRMQVIPWGT